MVCGVCGVCVDVRACPWFGHGRLKEHGQDLIHVHVPACEGNAGQLQVDAVQYTGLPERTAFPSVPGQLIRCFGQQKHNRACLLAGEVLDGGAECVHMHAHVYWTEGESVCT